MMEILMMVLGIIGTILIVGMYFLMLQDKINAKGFWFSFLNGVGAVCMLASIGYDYDPGDTGGLLVEACWAVISFYAAWRALRAHSRNVMPPPVPPINPEGSAG